MPDWIDSLHKALSYIEDHLTDEILPEDVARRAYVSAYHFQRIFYALCGVTLGEYIRCTVAQGLTEKQVIDVMVGDFQRMDVYARKGYQLPQDIPEDAWAAFRRLVEAGYAGELVAE